MWEIIACGSAVVVPQARCGIVSAGAVNNGYLYVAAGFNNSDVTNRVYYARINANGSLQAWQTSSTTIANARESSTPRPRTTPST